MRNIGVLRAFSRKFSRCLSIAAAVWVAGIFAAFGQSAPSSAPRPSPVASVSLQGNDFSLDLGLRPYNLAAQNDHRAPVILDPQKTAAILAYMKSMVVLPMVSRSVLDVSYHLGAAIAQRNPDKGSVIGFFVPQEIIPICFRNYQAFMAIYGVALSDVMSVEEINQLAANKNQPLPESLQKKFQEVMRRFSAGAEAQAGGLYAMLIATQKPHLEKYQLKLELSGERNR